MIRKVVRRLVLLLVLLAFFGLGLLNSVLGEDPAPERPVGLDPAKTLGPDTQQSEEFGCIKCHEPHYEAWRKTEHAGSLAMPREPLARGLRRKLRREVRGFKPNTSQLCMNCHFTVIETDSELKAAYGISCESCHGEGQLHVALHSDKQEDYELRMDAAAEAGMIRPTSLYRLAENCYQCHMLAKDVTRAPGEPTLEELVNLDVRVKTKAGKSTQHHPAGTLEFDLLKYSQGELRHNFNGGKHNPPSKHRHALWVVGKFLDLEYSLRALSNATDAKGTYFRSVRARFDGEQSAAAALKGVRGVLPADAPLGEAIDAALAAVAEAPLEVGQRDRLRQVAGEVQAAARSVFGEQTPAELAKLEGQLAQTPGLSALLPSETVGEAYEGKR